MTATERLRELLDERGVEWYDDDRGVVIGVDEPTTVASFKDYDGLLIGMMCICCTAERAVEATLGAGTCHMRLAYEEEDADGFIWPDHYECDSCGAKVNGIMLYCDTEIQPKFCPNCGRKVVG